MTDPSETLRRAMESEYRIGPECSPKFRIRATREEMEEALSRILSKAGAVRLLGVEAGVESEETPKIDRTATLTFSRDCTLCGGDIHVVNGERQRHTCRLPK